MQPKEHAMTSPTQRSLKKLRDDGWTAEVVEKWISYRDAKQDAKLWGLVADLLDANSMCAADPGNDEKERRECMALHALWDIRKLYKPPVMPGIRKDLFGFGDILAFGGNGPDAFLIVQATSFANLNARIAKATVIPEFDGWIAAGGFVEFHGWRVRPLQRGDGSTCKVVRFPETGREDG